ncbi:ATP-binding protein, partial [Neptuniibacter sp.]|uniref:ATP-binding protein n=1 Tax=Neptuniibacter sp. TaxID=1962643 RepID=UPI002632A77C
LRLAVRNLSDRSFDFPILPLLGSSAPKNWIVKVLFATYLFCYAENKFQLDELSNRARRSSGFQEFQQAYLNTEDYNKFFSELLSYWNHCTPDQAFDVLKRIYVETISERQLQKIVENRLAVLVDGDAATISDILAQLALNKVGNVLTAFDIWQHLESRSYKRRDWANDHYVLAAVDSRNQAYLNPLRRDAIAGDPIPRKEANQVLEILNSSSSKRVIMLVGNAGVGKSGVINLLAIAIEKDSCPFLAFRVDQLDPVLFPKAVGDQLNLPGSPANVLAAVAQGKKCVLFIDQLDAVSLVSGRHPQFFNCIDEIVQETRAHPNMYVLLACREFDLQNDARFRHLTDENGIAQIVQVNPLNQEIVRETLEKLNIDAKQLNEEQLELLSIPLHLSLLASISENIQDQALSFDTTRDLYDSYWDYKRRVIRDRRGGQSVKWENVIDSLCSFMSEHQVLYAPRRVVEDVGCSDDAEYMTSEHILIYEQQRYLFFHESFFDYAFARRFGARGHQLITMLLKSEQHLFRRAQVRQILTYERDANFGSNSRYLEAVRELLCHPNIRFHIKSVVFAILARLENPMKKEWEILEQILEDGDDLLVEPVWLTLYGSVAWVRRVHSLGLIQKWLTDDNKEQVNRAVTLLRSVQKEDPDLVAELVEPFVDKSEEWNNRLIYLMHFAELSKGRRFLDLYLHFIDSGLLDDVKGVAINSDFWSLIYLLPKENPEWACEVIRHRLDRLLALSLAEGVSNPFQLPQYRVFSSGSYDHVFAESARGAPFAFIEQFLPFMLRVIQLNLLEDGNLPGQDQVWYYRPFGKAHSIDTVLLYAMETAFCLVGSEQPQTFASITDELAKLDYETIQFLLIRGYTANASSFANTAIDYLLENPIRLQTGYRRHNC